MNFKKGDIVYDDNGIEYAYLVEENGWHFALPVCEDEEPEEQKKVLDFLMKIRDTSSGFKAIRTISIH